MEESGKRHDRIHIFFIRVVVSMVLAAMMMAGSLCMSFASDMSQYNRNHLEVCLNERQTVPEELQQLYAQSAVLMDADSGRILFAKNGQEERAMASTTKIMTCILALEHASENEVVTASEQAASQPKVKLGMTPGEQFYLKDLLYSLMLESHNDTAVAIAEAVAGDVPSFATMMNEKARELGCGSTYFITPNGLDASDSNGIHHTTAEDLARIMKYCIMDSGKKEEFLTVTRTAQYQFQDLAGNRSFSCYNHNAFLNMMEGALSGKTGFTADAGYCYVGSLQRENRTFIVALLACGWPNNKSYKWADTRTLMTYALEHYKYREVSVEQPKEKIFVENGIRTSEVHTNQYPQATGVLLSATTRLEPFSILLNEEERVSVEYEIPEALKAPVRKGEKIGQVRCYLKEELVREAPVYASENIAKRTWGCCLDYICALFLLKNSA